MDDIFHDLSVVYINLLHLLRDNRQHPANNKPGEMYFIFTLIAAAFFHVVFPCSLVPGTVFYSPTQRTVLAPIVFQGIVLNTTTSDDPTGQIFDACVRIQKIFKSPFDIPQVICFGSFGIEELCMTYVFEGSDYVFFMNEDFTARYDGFPVAALPVTDELVAAVQRGYCMGEDSLQQNCGKIKPLYSQNSPILSINISKFITETISIFLKSVIFAVI